MILWSPVFTFTTMTASLIRILWACFTQRCIFMNVDIINTTVILTVFFTTTFDFTGRFNIGLDVIFTSAIVIMIKWRGQLLSAWPASLWWDRGLTLLLLECHASAACLCKMIAFTTLITNETPGSTWMITRTCIAQTPTACLTCWWPVWRPGSVVSVGVDVVGSRVLAVPCLLKSRPVITLSALLRPATALITTAVRWGCSVEGCHVALELLQLLRNGIQRLKLRVSLCNESFICDNSQLQ